VFARPGEPDPRASTVPVDYVDSRRSPLWAVACHGPSSATACDTSIGRRSRKRSLVRRDSCGASARIVRSEPARLDPRRDGRSGGPGYRDGQPDGKRPVAARLLGLPRGPRRSYSGLIRRTLAALLPAGGSSSAAAPTPHVDASVETQWNAIAGARLLLPTDAGARWGPIARRRAPGPRPKRAPRRHGLGRPRS
jgi:hypothetical protein